MKLPQLKKTKQNYLLLSFLFPTVGMLILMLIGGYTPFGNRSMLYSDMWHQYYPFFKNFRSALLSGDSLLYNWSIGMGIDYLGLISYYLASPLNLLSVLVPEGWLLQYFELLVPIKLGLAGLFFAIFLKKTFQKDDLSLPLFGCFYAMCAWALGYQWNVMWLDTFALLPLVALGTISLLRDKKFILYTVTLFLSVFINYYIGLFTCIFVFLLFICYQVCRWKNFRSFLSDLMRIALFSVLAIGMTAILELPALAALQNTQSSVNSYPETFSLNIVSSELCKEARTAWSLYKTAKEAGTATFDLWWTALKASIPPILEGMRQVAGNMNGGLEPTFKEGLPNIYCGVGTITLAFLFLTCKQVKLRDKICSVLLLLFFMVSFLVRQLDYIWHGFHFTNMIPYRFSFLFSFVMLYMAYRAYLLWRCIKPWQIIAAGLLHIVIILCYDDLTDPVFLAYNCVFFLLYIAVFLYARIDGPLPDGGDRQLLREFFQERHRRRRYAGTALSVVMGLELILNLVNFGVTFPYTGISNYPNGTEHSASMIRYMQEDDDLFYRAEVTHAQTLNDSALNGYNGISAFTSSANVKVTEFMKRLGYAAKNTYNRYCFEESSPVSNLFLNLKYMLERDGNVEENPYFTEVHHYGDVYLLENNAYLPLGFLAQSELADFSFESNSSNAFLFQNDLFQAATGLTSDVWTIVPARCLQIEPNDTNITTKSSSGYCYYENGSAQTTMVYRYTLEDTGFLCLDLTMSARNSFTVWLNGTQLYSESLSLAQTLAVSQVEPGDVVEIKITCRASEKANVTIRAALLNDAVFQEGYRIPAASTLELTSFSNTQVEGTINCNRDGLLYTSIPQDGNWHVTVDGEEADIQLVGDAMVAVELTEGAHTLVFAYENEAFDLGWKISAVCLIIFAALAVIVYRENVKNLIAKFK